MKAYRINNYIIATDILEDAKDFFTHEIGDTLPPTIEEVNKKDEITCDDGRALTIKEIINEELDRRQDWLRMGIPCEMHIPFIVKKLA